MAQSIKFIKEILTPTNPRDIYYVNFEKAVMQYMIILLFGMAMIFYMMVY